MWRSGLFLLQPTNDRRDSQIRLTVNSSSSHASAELSDISADILPLDTSEQPDLLNILRFSIAEWLACWTRAQKGPGSNRSRDAVEEQS